jgi:pyruvate,water dikinase
MTRPSDGKVADPLHTSGGLTATFANVNSAEAWGAGVATPLGWTFFETATELGMRRALADFGALPRAQVQPPQDRNRRFLNVFYGRPGSNVALWRSVMDGIWGSSGAGYDETYHAGEGSSASPGRRRGGSVRSACKFVVTATRGRVVLARYRRELLPWWQAGVRPGSTSTIDEAKEKFRDAAEYNIRVIRAHSHVSWAGQSFLERLKAKCAAAGMPGLELELIASDDDFEEQGLIADVWAVSRDEQSLDDFLGRWGFQGPVVGELSSRSWREDPSPLLPIVDAYRAKPDAESPVTLKDRHRDARREVEQKLLARGSFLDRIRMRVLVHGARTFIPLRQVGRGTFLKTYDVARCMARRIGDEMVAAGVLADREDVFYLTQSELLDELPDDVGAAVEFRRERREYYAKVELPERWTGELTEDLVRLAVPEDVERLEVGERPERIEGLGVSVGVAEGRAIVITRPDAAYDLAPGDILVCVATDPSWAAIFYAVDALVTDVGAQMSHGAIVARELGIPAVVNTRTATRDLRTGDRIRVDGSAGVVDVLERASGAPGAGVAG